MPRRRSDNGSGDSAKPLITELRVTGYKSLATQQCLQIAPLTILAGANSSGKSSMMQPALLVKQTLESTYDTGALLIGGPNVRMAGFSQLFWQTSDEHAQTLAFGFEWSSGNCTLEFKRSQTGIELQRQIIARDGKEYTLANDMSDRALREIQTLVKATAPVQVVADRCFFVVQTSAASPPIMLHVTPEPVEFVQNLIHVTGIRPASSERGQRWFPKAAVRNWFVGSFDLYVASVLNDWQRHKDEELEQVAHDLQDLGLTWKVDVQEVSDLALTIRVGRLPVRPSRGGDRDVLNIADVGIGVSEVLPVVVALRVAKPGDTVYVEQPELHLHPRSQVSLASILANAAKRGVRVIAETHSSLLLLGVQALVAEGRLDPKLVKLHWFERNKDGATQVTPADLDEHGAFGKWPEDFDDVALETDRRYLDAVERQAPRK